LFCTAGVDSGPALDAAGPFDVETVLNVESILLDDTAARDAPLPLLEAGKDEATPVVLDLRPRSSTLEVKIIPVLILDPNPDPDTSVPTAFPTPRPLYR
jgi:hypothetical protein